MKRIRGGIQVSISELDEKGAGGGYRILGPKFCACHQSELLAKHTLDARDANAISQYLSRVEDRS